MKVLIISHNCISNYNNMGKAMLSIMSSFKKAEVCQLYIYPSLPDIDICNSYYRITDKELLNLAFFNNKKGKVISKEDIKTNNMLLENNGYKKYYQKKKNIFKKYARDMIWMFPFWFNDDLKQWLKKEKPTHIVAFPGDYCFFYNIKSYYYICYDKNTIIYPFIWCW